MWHKRCQTESASKLWRGLTDSEAQRRLRQFGPNTLPAAHKATLFSIAFATLKEPMLVLLLSTGVVYLLIGDLREAIAILASIFLVIGISVVQKQRTERTLEALRDLTSPRALVVRAESTRRIPAREVVPEDIVVLNEGDRVPADAQVVESVLLALDESLLTGESLPVQKVAALGENSIGEGDTTNSRVYSGSLVIRGHGIARVTDHRSANRDRKDRPSSGPPRNRIEQPRKGNHEAGPGLWPRQHRRLRASRSRLWIVAWKLGEGSAFRPGACHRNVAGRVSCCSHHFHGTRRLANLPEESAHTTLPGDRNARLGYGHLR